MPNGSVQLPISQVLACVASCRKNRDLVVEHRLRCGETVNTDVCKLFGEQPATALQLSLRDDEDQYSLALQPAIGVVEKELFKSAVARETYLEIIRGIQV